MGTKRSEGSREVLECSDIIIYHVMFYVGPAGVRRPDHFGSFLSGNENFSISLVLNICDEAR